jgi:hypothetical protein
MARLTARISRLETRAGAGENNELAHLSDAELDARICQAAERLTTQWRDMLRDGMSVADIAADFGRSPDNPLMAAVFAEAQAPVFDAARFFATLEEKRGAVR